MAYEYSQIIENNILEYLEGWSTTPTAENNNTDNTFLDDNEINELNITKTITSNELNLFWDKAVLLAEAYLQRNLDELEIDVCNNAIQNAIEMWTAGLIYRKYNIRVIDQTDETDTKGYGDELIIQAKTTLKPYKYRKLCFIS